MRILAFDPGAERCGWAVLEGNGQIQPVRVDSGVIRVPRQSDEKHEAYKLRLIHYWTFAGPKLLNDYVPDLVLNETVPAIGFNTVQGQLAQAQIIAVQTLALEREFLIKQIAATTVKVKIAGAKTATKVKVRNGVIQLLPELAPRKFEWTKEFEEPDALAIGLAELGYTNTQKVN
jgi:Holliday junction resolvasome RuvABC endonuclease subunit